MSLYLVHLIEDPAGLDNTDTSCFYLTQHNSETQAGGRGLIRGMAKADMTKMVDEPRPLVFCASIPISCSFNSQVKKWKHAILFISSTSHHSPPLPFTNVREA